MTDDCQIQIFRQNYVFTRCVHNFENSRLSHLWGPRTVTNEVTKIAVHCFDCYRGRYELVTRDEEYPMTDGSRMVLPRLNYLRCEECGFEVLTSESNQYILGFGPPAVEE